MGRRPPTWKSDQCEGGWQQVNGGGVSVTAYGLDRLRLVAHMRTSFA